MKNLQLSIKAILMQMQETASFVWSYSQPYLNTGRELITDPVFLLASGTGVGFLQVIQYRYDLTIDLLFVVFLSFSLMSFLGVCKHIKEGTANGKEFLKKTVIQLAVSAAVIALGYIVAIITNIAFKILNESMPGETMVFGVTLYWTFAGYAIVLTYYVLKIGEFINVLIPQFLPQWFTAGFARFHKTGKVRDLLTGGEEGLSEKEENKDLHSNSTQ